MSLTHALKFTKVTVLLTDATDRISIDLDAPTPFPEMGYQAKATIEARAGYGVEWCRKVLGVEPEIIDASSKRSKIKFTPVYDDILPPIDKISAKGVAKPARLDADKTAKPKTRLIGHQGDAGVCLGPGSIKPDALEDMETGKRTPLK